MKKNILFVLLLLVLFIPSYIAIYRYATALKEPVSQEDVTAMKVVDPVGKIYYYEKSNPDGENMIEFFTSIADDSRKIGELPDDLSAADFYSVFYTTHGVQTEYRYYFSKTKPSNSYYTDNQGQSYRISAPTVIRFLDSECSEWLYPKSNPATVSLNSVNLTAQEFSWNYYTYSNVRHEQDVKTDQNVQTVRISYGDFTLRSDPYADDMRLKITEQNGSVYFSGTYADFREKKCFSKLRADETFNLEITANWSDSAANGFGGHAVFKVRLEVIYDPPGTFWIGEDTVYPGEFVVLSGVNVDDIVGITLSITPSINYTPVFRMDGEYVRTIIPFPLSLGTLSSDYQISVGYLGVNTTFDVHIVNDTSAAFYSYKTRKFNYSNKINTKLRTDENLKSFADFITAAPYGDTFYATGAFKSADTMKDRNRARFGDTINNGTKDEQFVSNGMAFVSYKEDAVASPSYGRVVKVGVTKYGGNTVVIEHGLGLRSVIYCLGSVSVTEGDYVKAGGIIGHGGAGAGGYTDGITCYWELWLYDVPVSYVPLLENGRTQQIVIGDPPADAN